jgi:hypothetical protein
MQYAIQFSTSEFNPQIQSISDVCELNFPLNNQSPKEQFNINTYV